jgi:protein involved in polysaccharide export with SLBB domain
MKLSRQFQRGLLLCAGLFIAGCSHLYYVDPNATSTYVFPGQTNAPQTMAQAPAGPPIASLSPVGVPATQPVPVPPATVTTTPRPANPPGNTVSDILGLGDSVTVSFSDIPAPGLLPVVQRIGNDGKISLPYNVKVAAAGKTVGQLQDDIRSAYVPNYFVFMTCSVQSEQRVFFVDGEVKLAGRLPYLGEMTVLRAISSAQGFTDFANRKKVELRRATGQKMLVDWNKAIEDPKKDLPVYPNDHIFVHRRTW